MNTKTRAVVFSLWALLTGLFTHSLYAQWLAEDTFVVIGDTGKNNPEQRFVAESIAQTCLFESCQRAILTGDVIYPAGMENSQDLIVTQVFDQYYNFLNLPFMIALGNHDYGKLSRSFNRGQFQLEHAQKNPLFVLPHYWYQFETTHAIVVVLDTTRMMWKRDIQPQAEMVEKALLEAKDKNKWFIVAGHHPFLSNGRHGNAGKYERVSQPSFVSGKHVARFMRRHVCYKADLYLSGHDHSLQVIDGNQAECGTMLIVSGSGADTDGLSNRNQVLFQNNVFGFFHLSIGPETLTAKAYTLGAKPLYINTFNRKPSLEREVPAAVVEKWEAEFASEDLLDLEDGNWSEETLQYGFELLQEKH